MHDEIRQTYGMHWGLEDGGEEGCDHVLGRCDRCVRMAGELQLISAVDGSITDMRCDQIAMILSPSSGSSWLPSTVRLPIVDGATGGSQQRRVIEYRDADGGDDESVRAEVERLNKDSNLASQVEAERTRSVGLWREHENWRDSGEGA